MSLELEQARKENAHLVSEFQCLKQVCLTQLNDLRTAHAKMEDLEDELGQAKEEKIAMRKTIDELKKEKLILEEDKGVQEAIARDVRTYTSILENMLDQEKAYYAPSCSEDQQICQAAKDMKAKLELAQQKSAEHEEMLEEFKSMWKKDSLDFQETMKTVKEEAAKLQEAVLRAEERYRQDQEALASSNEAREEEESAHGVTMAKNWQLQTEAANLRSNLEKKEREVVELVKKQEASDYQLVQQENWLKSQHDEFSASMDQLIKNRNETAQKIEEMKTEWRLEKDALVLGSAENKRCFNDVSKKLMAVKTESQDTICRMSNDYEELCKEYASYQADTSKQLQMLKSESNVNYDRYMKFEKEVMNLQKQLKASKETREKENEMYTATIDEMEAELNETKSNLESVSKEHKNTAVALQNASAELFNYGAQIKSLTENLMLYQHQYEVVKVKMDQLQERLNVAGRNYVAEKERLEQKQEDTIAAMQQMHVKQIEEIKHNNMLAINQEMIKAQMALDSEKKKNAVEYGAIEKRLAQAVRDNESSKKASDAKIATLNQDMAGVKSEKAKLYADMMQAQRATTRQIESLDGYIEELEQRLISQKDNYEQQIEDLKEAHLVVAANLGVEVLDEEESAESDEDEEAESSQNGEEFVEVFEEKDDSNRWELVEEM